MRSLTTCLIPFYNEKERILATIQEISKVRGIAKIVCVDDGSTDKSTALIKNRFPSVKIIRLDRNQGKTNAIFEGVRYIDTKYTLMFDADLYDIKSLEIEVAVEKIQADPKIDMIILRRIVESRFLSLIRHDVVMSGQRILKTEDLVSVAKLHPNKYQIEMAVNHHLNLHKKKAYWMPITTKNPKKHAKWGIKGSISQYFDVFTGYFTYYGVQEYLRQVLFFCRESI